MKLKKNQSLSHIASFYSADQWFLGAEGQGVERAC